ncbi:hypothetical protein [Gordonia sp. UCD-TK1]|uniref:hypothetical protein n=1 Tax=Gordonia sp. UCD-TK1 TaxID=1857893 RepID=UPI00080DD22A|nr:hypothetical protein [Gordonia sp. UCD-TK1]OCH80968.1 hypothetical protein A9310_19585 [Gordonia sp. UCD-TK1]
MKGASLMFEELVNTFTENLAACWMAAAGMFVGVLLLIDRRTQRRWEPLTIKHGEIVESDQ